MIMLDRDVFMAALTNQNVCSPIAENFVSKSPQNNFDCSLHPFFIDYYLCNVMVPDGFQK